MGKFHHTLALSCLLTALPVTVTQAADFRFPPEPVVPVPSPIPIPDYNTWYFRGDIGWAFHKDPDWSQTGFAFTNPEIDDTWTIGGGFGYVFRDKIRGDITVDHRFDTEMTAADTTGSAHRSDLSSTVWLANLYYDVMGRQRISPYVGFGLGIAFNETDTHTVWTGGVQTAASGGNNSTEFAYAAMAGISYRLRDSWMLDAGYRYLNIGDVKTDNSATLTSLQVDDISAHELRIGFRYEFR